MSRPPVTITVTDTGTGTSRRSSALQQPQPQGQTQAPQQQLLAPSSATQQTQAQSRRRSSAAINAEQLQSLGFGAMPQRSVGLARGSDEAPSTSTSTTPPVPVSRRNSQAFLRCQSVAFAAPMLIDLFIRVKFDGILVYVYTSNICKMCVRGHIASHSDLNI